MPLLPAPQPLFFAGLKAGLLRCRALSQSSAASLPSCHWTGRLREASQFHPACLARRLQAVIAAVNGLSQASPSYPYVFKAQTPSAPNKLPLPNASTQLPTFTPSSPPPPAPEPPSDNSGKDNKDNNNNNNNNNNNKSTGGGGHKDGNGGGGKNGNKKGDGNGGNNGGGGGGGNRRLLNAWVETAAGGPARVLLQSKSGGICPKDSSFIVQQASDCEREPGGGRWLGERTAGGRGCSGAGLALSLSPAQLSPAQRGLFACSAAGRGASAPHLVVQHGDPLWCVLTGCTERSPPGPALRPHLVQ